MKFWNVDYHVSVIADIKDIFESLGHTVTNVSCSGHTWVMGWEHRDLEGVGVNCCDPDRFYNTYKKDLDGYDAFIVTYPPHLVRLYERFDKPVIVQIPVRFNFPFQIDISTSLCEYFRKGIDNGKVIVSANSIFDQKYFEKHVGRDCYYIPSLCRYTGVKWVKGIKNGKWLVYSNSASIQHEYCVNVTTLCRHKWEDLLQYNGVIHIPYQISTMSMFEQYTAEFPMLFPTKDFLLSIDGALNQIFTKDVNIKEWIHYADYYTQPGITYFDSWPSLYAIIGGNFSLPTDRNLREREEQVLESWKRVLKRISF